MISRALAFLRGPAPIENRAELVDFFGSRAAFLVQKSVMDYARARTGSYFTMLIKEEEFRQAVERARWTLYPVGLALVGEMVDAYARESDVEPARSAAAVAQLAAEAMNQHPVPEIVGADEWTKARADLVEGLERLSGRPPKPVMDMPMVAAETVFAHMPIHENRRDGDFEVVRNHLRSNLCALHQQLERRISPERLSALLLSAPGPTL